MVNKKTFITLILIVLMSCLLGYLNAKRVNQSFFSLPPSGDHEKLHAARKELNSKIPLVEFERVEKVYEENSMIFIDARNTEEFEKGHIDNSISLPQHSLEKHLPEFLQKYDKKTPFLIYCGGLDCSASIQLANELFEKGFRELEVYSGGWKEWQKRHQEKKQ